MKQNRMRLIPRPTPYHNPNRPVQYGHFGALGIAPAGIAQSGATVATTAALESTTIMGTIGAGAEAGSVAGPIGAAVGIVVGVVVGILTRTNNTASHIGSWDGGLTQAIGGLPSSAAGIGRQIPWNENSHGLVQMIEALLATGIYMAWDTSLKSNYDVAAHWAMTFGAAVQAVAQAVVGTPAGQTASVSIALSPGAGGHGPITFNFANPGVQVGPDRISATIIMGSAGLMGAMMMGLGGQAQANIVSNENNGLAQKVYALMLDYWFAQLAPQAAAPTKPVPVIAPAVAAASVAANKVAATLPVAPPPVNPPPSVAVVAASQPPAQMNIQAQQQPNIVVVPGQTQQFAPTAAPTTGLFGMSDTEILLIGGVVVAVVLMSRK